MITRMHVKHFKGIEEVQTRLGKLTVCTGQSATGKSSFLESLYALTNSKRFPVEDCFWSSWNEHELIYNFDGHKAVEFHSTVAPGPDASPQLNYELSLKFTPTECSVVRENIAWVDGPNHVLKATDVHRKTYMLQHWLNRPHGARECVEEARKYFHPSVAIRLEPAALRTPDYLPPNEVFPFRPNGYGLASCLADLKLQADDRYQLIEKTFCEWFPRFQGLQVHRIENPGKESTAPHLYHILAIQADGPDIPANLLSSGMVLCLAYITLRYHQTDHRLFLIENVENGLDSYQLAKVVALFFDWTESNEDSQTVLITQSPQVIDLVKSEDVRIFHRTEDGKISILDVGELSNVKNVLKKKKLGEKIYADGLSQVVKNLT